jgi:hypothetical protein
MCDPTKKVVVAYKWDGQCLTNVAATGTPLSFYLHLHSPPLSPFVHLLMSLEHEEVGKWDGVRIAWMDGSHEEPDSSLTYIFHEVPSLPSYT